eukprot:TRINITY_DN20506_c0_g1_i2.p1 TRINITY_DN20506_c0_g1~~TRINITY_DN20506_c0_g1_i2.p1  ORF type:complete len:690 (+),score=99.80 TRINITY_DN20506_c0_g1_i2:81-2150(+)
MGCLVLRAASVAPRDIDDNDSKTVVKKTGDAVIVEKDAVKSVLFVHVESRDVTFHISRHHANMKEEPLEFTGPYTPAKEIKLTAAHRNFIYRGKVPPSSEADVSSTVPTVVWHAVLSVLGLMPGIGALPLMYLTWLYFVRNRHLDLSRPALHSVIRSLWSNRSRVSWFFECIKTDFDRLVMIPLCVYPFQRFMLIITVLQDLRKADENDQQDILQDGLHLMQRSSVLMMCSISSVLLARVLAVNTIQVCSDIGHFKAKAKESMKGYAKVVLDGLEREFPETFKPFNPPMHTMDDYFKEDISLCRKSVAYVSGFCMCIGQVGVVLSWHVRTEGFNELYFGVGVLMAMVSGMNWTRFYARSLGSAIKLKETTKHFLLFRTTSTENHFGTWRKTWKIELRNILKKLPSEVLSEIEKARKASDSDEEDPIMHYSSDGFRCNKSASLHERPDKTKSDGEQVIENIPDASLEEFVHNVVHRASKEGEKQKRLHLCNIEDAIQWWALREFLLLDRIDESCVVEYSIAVSLIILLGFCCVGFVDWTVNKATITQANVDHDDVLSFFGPIGVMLVTSTVIFPLMLPLYEMMRACVDINELFEDDAKMLRRGQVQAQKALQTSKKDQGDAQAIVSFLGSMRGVIEGANRKQKLFGLVVDSKLLNWLILSGLSVVVGWLWKQLIPFAINVDLDLFSNDVT